MDKPGVFFGRLLNAVVGCTLAAGPVPTDGSQRPELLEEEVKSTCSADTGGAK